MPDGWSGGGGANNAEASSSRRVASTNGGKRGRSQNRGRESKDASVKSPTIPASLSPRPDGPSTRRVRTVPPSARYEPPSPPSPVHSPLPNAPPTANTQRSKQRRRLRYSSSESSSDDESDSDDEPPWWTFTQRGMMRLRARNLHDGAVTEGESGKESGKEKSTKSENRTSGMFSSSRRSSKDNKERPGSSNKIRKRDSGGESPSKPGSTSTLSAKLLQPAPIRLASTQSFFRRSQSRPDGAQATASTPSIVFVPPVRPSSAPTSPTLDAPSPGLTTLVDGTSSRFPSAEGPPPSISDLSTLQHPIPKRQLTTPAFPRFFRRDFINDEPTESLTDTETVPSARAKVAKSKSASIPPPLPRIITEDPSGNSTSTPDGTSTPTRPKTRQRPSHRLRLNLPPPITHHFSHGWPHAGSWQDALNGSYFDDGVDSTAMRPSRSRRSTKLNEETNGEAAPVTPTTRTRPQSLLQEQMGQQEDIPEDKEATTKRTKSKRARRYRQALVPPTPSGLGFTPRTRTSGPDEYPWTEGHDPESGFDWQNGAKKVVPEQVPGRTESPSPNMSHADTLDTAHTEKTESDRGTKRRWGLFRRKPRPRGSMVDSDWRRRYRRILFLDARVTIWIRLLNLAVVIALLVLAVKIRLGLITLQLPGVIGSSTTLIIAYSSFTMLHVLTAIYREYFGKPIGLWGLRSKMLWVCLDLLFVALWSSAMSLAINDLIATPLDCTPFGAWWRVDLADDYASLLQSLANTTSSTGTSTSSGAPSTPTVVFTSVSGITKTLGITLPSSVLSSSLTHHVCREQQGCIALSLLALLLYGGNMVLSLFRIFETVRRTAGANPSKAIPV